MQHLKLTDIFRTAFFLAMGGTLEEVQIGNNGRRTGYFMIQGENLNELDKTYRSGRALVEPLKFRASLNYVKDLMFEKLREDRENEKGEQRYASNRKNSS